MVHYRFLITDLEDLLEGDHGEEHQLATRMLHKALVLQDGAWAEHLIHMQTVERPLLGIHLPGPRTLTLQTVERLLLGTHLPGRRTLTLQTVARPQRGMHLREHPIRTHQVGGPPHGRTQAQLRAGLLPVQRQRTTMVGEAPAPCKIVEQAVGALPLPLAGEREAIPGDIPLYVLIKFPDDIF